jgi:hypothetical protein
MRAADQAHSSPAESVQASPDRHLSSMLIALVATGALLLVWHPAVLHGQAPTVQPPAGRATAAASAKPPSPAARTHVVKAGETLWGLAARYYGDGHSWQTLAKRNDISTAGGTPPLVVGMKLSVPATSPLSGAKAAAAAAAPADSTVPKVALAKAGEGTMPKLPVEPKSEAVSTSKAPAGSLAAQTSGKVDAEPAAAPGRGANRAAPKTPREPAVEKATVAAATPTGSTADTSRVDFSRQKGTVMAGDGAVRVGLVDSDAQMASRKSSEVLTVFHRDIPDAAEAERRTAAILRPNTPAPRQGELDAAPFVIPVAQLASTGAITARVGAPDGVLGAYKQRAMKTDEIELQPPAKGSYAVGDRLQAFTTSPSTAKGKVIATPTGVVEVVRVTAGGRALAVVRMQSGRIEQGQHLIVAAGAPAPRYDLTKMDASDLSTSVTWLDPAQALPTVQCFLLIRAGAANGVKPGDEFALYYTPKGGVETVTARARVVRADGDGSTAVITKQYRHEIEVGMTARRVGRAP